MTTPRHLVNKATPDFTLNSDWDGPDWKPTPTADVDFFLTQPIVKASDHRPKTQVKLVYDAQGIYALFKVIDRYVKCIHTEPQSATCYDSCVEWFIRPKPDADPAQGGYFNFEINCGGAVKCRYTVIDGTGEKVTTQPLDARDLASLTILPSLPKIVDPEIETETVWTLGLYVPFTVLERYVGPLSIRHGQTWRVNFYKCGNQTSHPHYAAWAPVDVPNFHTPRCFGSLEFREPMKSPSRPGHSPCACRLEQS